MALNAMANLKSQGRGVGLRRAEDATPCRYIACPAVSTAT
jgi:hypothetical protein